MPELPDITVYCESIAKRTAGSKLEKVVVANMFVLRTVEPTIEELVGRSVQNVFRLGKRIVLEFDGHLFLVIHLMVAGRLLWTEPDKPPPSPRGKGKLAMFQFQSGHLLLTEAGSRRRASISVVSGPEELKRHDPGGVEPLECSLSEFSDALRRENRTLKRALTNPRTISGIGNAYSDEILHAAKISPLKLTQSLSDAEMERLWTAVRATLDEWTDRLRKEFADKFPGRGQVTAFRPDFAVHGKHGQPCPVCSLPVQRIAYSENETNYCAKCQNEGRILADRSLSRLLKSDWPKTIEEMVGD